MLANGCGKYRYNLYRPCKTIRFANWDDCAQLLKGGHVEMRSCAGWVTFGNRFDSARERAPCVLKSPHHASIKFIPVHLGGAKDAAVVVPNDQTRDLQQSTLEQANYPSPEWGPVGG